MGPNLSCCYIRLPQSWSWSWSWSWEWLSVSAGRRHTSLAVCRSFIPSTSLFSLHLALSVQTLSALHLPLQTLKDYSKKNFSIKQLAFKKGNVPPNFQELKVWSSVFWHAPFSKHLLLLHVVNSFITQNGFQENGVNLLHLSCWLREQLCQKHPECASARLRRVWGVMPLSQKCNKYFRLMWLLLSLCFVLRIWHLKPRLFKLLKRWLPSNCDALRAVSEFCRCEVILASYEKRFNNAGNIFSSSVISCFWHILHLVHSKTL